MTEREKIIEILKQTSDLWKEEESHGYIVSVDLGKIADTLIEAGIGDKSGYRLFISKDGTEIKQLYSCEEVEQIANERDEYKHRAEVAERALLTACVSLIKDEEDNVNMELLAHVVYTKFLRKAEKELAEEG